jgi:hypothetical protein
MKQEYKMKQSYEKIEREVAKTMQLLDELKPLEVNHHFRARLMQRIDAECMEGSRQVKSGFSRYLDARLAFMVLLVIINLGSALLSLQNSETQLSAGISEVIDSMSDDYTTQEFAYYDQTAATAADSGVNDNRTP